MQARPDGRIKHAAAAEILRVRCCYQGHRAPPQWAGRGKRLSGLLRFVARPDQVVRAVLGFDQAGIDRCGKRRVVEGHGDVGPSGFAGLLPCRADIVACRRKSGALSLSPLSLGTSLTLTFSVRVRSWPV